MNNYFNVNIEFDKNKVDEVIQSAIEHNQKGYVCSIEANNFAMANKNAAFRDVLNNSLVNICDGSIMASLLSFIHKKKFQPYVGADLFDEYVRKKKYKQFFLGNTVNVLTSLKENLSQLDPAISYMSFKELPFCGVDEFDYPAIAKCINDVQPDIIWISLGAPKQEIFMSKLLPFLNKGIMFGFGAIFNFNSNVGKVRRAPLWMRRNKLEWLYRAFEEPKKNIPRYWNFIRIMPRLLLSEYRKLPRQSQFKIA